MYDWRLPRWTAPFILQGFSGKTCMQTYKFRNEFTALSKKLEDATKINLKTCMKCRTDGSNFVNKIRMQCVFLLHKSHADTKTGRKKSSVHNGIPIGRLFFCRGKCRTGTFSKKQKPTQFRKSLETAWVFSGLSDRT